MQEDQINSLIMRCLTGEASREDQALLKKLLMNSPDHQQMYNESEKLWTLASPSIVADAPSKEVAWQNMRDRIISVPKQKPVKRFNLYNILAVAAGLIIMLGGLLYYHYTIDQASMDWQTPAHWQERMTSNGERMHFVLSDSTVVQMNAATVLSYPEIFPDSMRIVHLEGEAFFNVASDSSHPFVIETPYSRIYVYGTEFNVWSRQQETRVVVKSGRVFLTSAKTTSDTGVHISENQMSIHRQSFAAEPPISVNAERKIGWLNGMLVFEQTSLTEIIEETQRFYDVHIIIDDPALSSRRLTATFNNQPVTSVLDAISISLGTKYVIEQGRYVITRMR